jgi:hypothetical protein
MLSTERAFRLPATTVRCSDGQWHPAAEADCFPKPRPTYEPATHLLHYRSRQVKLLAPMTIRSMSGRSVSMELQR